MTIVFQNLNREISDSVFWLPRHCRKNISGTIAGDSSMVRVLDSRLTDPGFESLSCWAPTRKIVRHIIPTSCCSNKPQALNVLSVGWYRKRSQSSSSGIKYAFLCCSEEFPRLRIFNHQNLLAVLAASSQPPHLVMISQYMNLGSLYHVLHGGQTGEQIEYLTGRPTDHHQCVSHWLIQQPKMTDECLST